MKETDLLRPVEAYFLLSFAKKEDWGMVEAITAVLVELYERDLIIPDGTDPNTFIANYVDANRDDLRSYESTALEAINFHDPEFLYDAVDDFRFKNFLIKKGLLVKERRYFFFLHYQQTVLSPAGLEAVSELLIQRESLRKQQTAVLSAVAPFPSLGHSNSLLAYLRSFASKAVMKAGTRYMNFMSEDNPILGSQPNNFVF